jgi:hypothetical protein
MLVDWRKYGESAFGVRVLEVLPYGVQLPDAQKAELRWQAHFARLGQLYNAARCAMCGQPHDLDLGETVDLQPSDETATLDAAATRARRPQGQPQGLPLRKRCAGRRIRLATRGAMC